MWHALSIPFYFSGYFSMAGAFVCLLYKQEDETYADCWWQFLMYMLLSLPLLGIAGWMNP